MSVVPRAAAVSHYLDDQGFQSNDFWALQNGDAVVVYLSGPEVKWRVQGVLEERYEIKFYNSRTIRVTAKKTTKEEQ